MWVDRHRLGTVVGFVNPNQAVRQLKHVVSQRDDDKLSILRSLLKYTTIPHSSNKG